MPFFSVNIYGDKQISNKAMMNSRNSWLIRRAIFQPHKDTNFCSTADKCFRRNYSNLWLSRRGCFHVAIWLSCPRKSRRAQRGKELLSWKLSKWLTDFPRNSFLLIFIRWLWIATNRPLDLSSCLSFSHELLWTFQNLFFSSPKSSRKLLFSLRLNAVAFC